MGQAKQRQAEINRLKAQGKEDPVQVIAAGAVAANRGNCDLFFQAAVKLCKVAGHTSGYEVSERAGHNVNSLVTFAATKAAPDFWVALHGYLQENHKGMDYLGGIADLLGGALVCRGLGCKVEVSYL